MATTAERIRWIRRRSEQHLEALYLDRLLTPRCRRAHPSLDVDRTVTLMASRRGGSTWVQELLSSGPGVCPLFEPLFGTWYRRRHGLGVVPLPRPGQEAPELEQFLREVMAGRRLTPMLRRLCDTPELLAADQFLVKHVRLSLAAGWLLERFPRSPMVLLVRHPCAVVESLERVRWGPDTVEQALSEVPPVEQDQVRQLVGDRPTTVGVLAGIWAVEVRALLDQTTPATAHLLTYEAVCADPVGVLGPVMEAVGLPRPPDLAVLAARPSETTGSDSVVRTHGDPVRAWLDRMDPRARDEVLAVAAAAGVPGYSRDPLPDEAALRERHAEPPTFT